MKIHDEKYGNKVPSRLADRIAQEMRDTKKGDYVPSSRDRVSYIRDRHGIASLVVWLPWKGQLYIGVSWTRPDRRKEGLYRALIEYLKGVAQAKKLECLALGVMPTNTRSIATHKRLGFKAKVLYFELRLGANPAK